MPAPEYIHCLDYAVLWARAGRDRHGSPILSAPVELRVRWDDSQREGVDKDGNTIAIDAQVIVTRDVPVGSEMWHGTLASWLGTGSVGDDTEVMQVVGFESVKDLKQRATFREVSLMRFKDSP